MNLAIFLEASAWASLLTLTAMEIVLGIDNVVFISVLVSRLPKEMSRRARQIGLSLALVFRILLLMVLSWLIGLTGKHRPTAVFFANYLMAMGALTEFHDQGVRVPDDIALAVFDDLPQLEYVRPRLTRAGKSPSVLAQRAAQMLLDRLSGRYDGPPRTEIIECTLQVYESA